MIPVIIVLLVTGCVLIVASFVFKDSLSGGESGNVMTEEQIERLLESRFRQERSRLEDETEKSADLIRNQTERELEKLSNEKIMAVNEYSDQVIDQINKNHNEVLFLYSMLNDKQKELDSAMKKLTKAKQQTENETKIVKRARVVQEEKGAEAGRTKRTAAAAPAQPAASVGLQRPKPAVRRQENATSSQTGEEKYQDKEKILKLYEDGMSSREIAQKLHLGIGEVRLVLELSKERS